ncbi:MAG: 50S ribosomal protein L7/L12 [Candidatus Aquirickettsiella sp.]
MSADDKAKEVLTTVSNMKVMEIVELIKKMEEEFGVSAAAPVAAAPVAGAAAAEAGEEKTEFSVKLEKVVDKETNVVGVIKIVREMNPQLGLREAKELVDKVKNEKTSVPIKEGIPKKEAEDLVARLEKEKAGAKIE